jgi:hypothetical protein
MSLSKITGATLVCALLFPLLPTEASARTKVTVRRAATRVVVEPNLLAWHRRCTDWYALERRPSGTVLTPHMRCWWTRN